MTEQEIEKLAMIVAEVIEKHREEAQISPAWIATEVMLKLDPTQVSPPLVHAGCHLEVRQLARAELRRRFDDQDDDADDDPYLTLADVTYNIARLRSEANAKLKHADRLQSWWKRQQAKA